MLRKILKKYTTKTSGSGFDKKIYLMKDNKEPLSFWHDIPYMKNKNDHVNVVIEVPRFELAKMEVSKEDKLNPIMQDTSIYFMLGKNRHDQSKELRYYPQFLFFNYGFIPQTWENPNKLDKEIQLSGDNDPLDILEVGSRTCQVGEVLHSKILGSFCLIDQGEIDWKILTINDQDPLYEKLHSIQDIQDYHPGLMKGIFNFFTNYKTFDGKKENEIYGKKCFDQKFTKSIVQENHESYVNLCIKKNKELFYFH